VMIEAMANGTPVIAFNCGSVPEVVDHGDTGFIVNSVDEAVMAVSALPKFDRRLCREIFEHRYSARVMAKNYVSLYEKLIEEKKKIRIVNNLSNGLNQRLVASL